MKKYSNDKRVVFNSEDHSYFLGKKRLVSVTTFLNKYKNEFDSDFYSKKISLREGVSQNEILDKWKQKALKSTTIGTAIHKIFEDYINNKYSKINETLVFDFEVINLDYIFEFENKKKIAIDFINSFFETKRLVPIATELIVYNDILAGQIDCVCKDNDGNFYIIDFKTNEKIEDCSYNKFYKHELSFIPESTLNTYSLQLSIYKSMLKEYDIKDLYLIHITEKKYSFIKCKDFVKDYNLFV